MLVHSARRALSALSLALAVLPFSARAQVREVVSKEVSVGRSSAVLTLEFADGGGLAVAFEDGVVRVGGRAVGSFEQGDELDAAWRGLLGRAVALDDGPLAEALAEWTAPPELAGQLAEVGRSVDRALEEAVRGVEVQAETREQSGSAAAGDAGGLLRALLGSASRLSVLEDALEDLDLQLRVHVDEDVTVAADEVVAGTLVAVEGDVRIEGTVDGDVVVVGGTLELLEGSSVTGEVRLVDARLLRNEGTVLEGVIDIDSETSNVEVDVRRELRDELRDEIRRELRLEIRDRDRGMSILAPFRPVVRAVGGVVENLVAIILLALIGAAVIAFGGDKIEVIAETARRAPARSAAVGMAATVLLIPVWIMGFVALLVSIVGIPVAIAWLPLFPLAAILAGIVGYLAVARNAGEWLADSGYPWTHWIRKSNTLVTMVGGLIGLMLLFVAANVISMAPFLGVVTGLLVAAGCLVTVMAVEVGLGAVILTRAGRRPERWSSYSADEAWEAAIRVDLDDVADVGASGDPDEKAAEADRPDGPQAGAGSDE